MEPMDSGEMIGNGIGSDIEQVRATIGAHKLWAKGWMARCVTLGLRNRDMISSDRFDFTHAASIELEMNQHATGCAGCMRGDCTRPIHFINDPTYNDQVEWTAINYANTDHMRGVK